MAGEEEKVIDLCESQSPQKTTSTSQSVQSNATTSNSFEAGPSHAGTSQPSSSSCTGHDSDLEDWSEIISSDYVPEVCMMECGCCFGEEDVDKMVQCSDGHLFCSDCLQRYAQEAIHGQGKSQLTCMTADCEAQFPRSQMKRALTEELIKKFDERVQEESLNLAALQNLVRCPDCNYAAKIVDEQQKVFVCPQCEKRSCRHCHADWNDHEGLSCKQVEKKDETSLRTKYEEKMTAARVRHCPKCKTPLLKEGGCNKVTCRCGGTICYICRKENIEYNHFCQHPQFDKKAKGCKQCNSCSLWTDAEADDRRIIEELKAQGQHEIQELGFSDERKIGAPADAQDKAATASAARGARRHVHQYQIPPGPIQYPVPAIPAIQDVRPAIPRPDVLPRRPVRPAPLIIQPGTTSRERKQLQRAHTAEIRRYKTEMRVYEQNLAAYRVYLARQEPAAMAPMVFNAPPYPFMPPMPELAGRGAALPVPAVAADLLTGRGGAVNFADRDIRLPQQQPDDIFMRGAVRARAPTAATAPHQVSDATQPRAPAAAPAAAHRPVPAPRKPATIIPNKPADPSIVPPGAAPPKRASTAVKSYAATGKAIKPTTSATPTRPVAATAAANIANSQPSTSGAFNSAPSERSQGTPHSNTPVRQKAAAQTQLFKRPANSTVPLIKLDTTPLKRKAPATVTQPPVTTLANVPQYHRTGDLTAVIKNTASVNTTHQTDVLRNTNGVATNNLRKSSYQAVGNGDISLGADAQPSTSGTQNNHNVAQPSTSGTQNHNAAQPSTSGTQNHNAAQPSTSGTQNHNAAQSSTSGTQNHNAAQPSTSGTQNHNAAQSSTSGTQNHNAAQPSTSGTQNHNVTKSAALSSSLLLDSDGDDDLLFKDVLPNGDNTATTNNTHPGQSATRQVKDASVNGRDEEIHRLQVELNELEARMTSDMERDHEARIDAMYTAMEREREELRTFIAGRQEEINRKRKLRAAAGGGGEPAAKKPTPADRFEL